MSDIEATVAMRDFEGKVAVVTGAASGIGRALAERLLGERMKVVLADIDSVALESLVESLRAEGHDVLGVPTNVASLESVENLARATIAAYGAVHVLCNNAGVTKHTGQAVWELTDNDWQWLMGVNFWAVVHGLRVFVPLILDQKDVGYIVNTASISGLVVGGGGYGVAKHAVVSLSENLHVDLRKQNARIGVTCLCPGLVATKIVDSERSRPHELANEVPESEAHRNHRDRVAAFTSREGKPPSVVADAVIDAMREGRFYVCTDDPPSVVSADVRIRARMEAILDRQPPVAFALRKSESRG